jgi:A/G-specific adenine glycosylase
VQGQDLSKPRTRSAKPDTRALPPEHARVVASALAPWFLASHRDLSWRRTRDPYAIWVSEIMLQQTRVETVERYWSTFLARFPDVGALAAADTDEVLAAWSGLGYYRRARLLHRGAQVVAAEHGAKLPTTAAGLREVPGIGPYTAGAIAAIAYDEPAPLVDGNVARVLSRLVAERDPKEQLATAKWMWTACAEILRHGSPRVLGQALMELGATVCTPRSPRCAACPLAHACRANAEEATAEIPAVRERIAQPTELWWGLAIAHGGAILLERRDDAGLLARMWCLPLVPRDESDDAPERSAIAKITTAKLGSPRIADTPVVHVFTHRRWEIRVVVAKATKRFAPETPHVWLEPGERPPGGLPTLTRKLLAAARAQATV